MKDIRQFRTASKRLVSRHPNYSKRAAINKIS